MRRILTLASASALMLAGLVTVPGVVSAAGASVPGAPAMNRISTYSISITPRIIQAGKQVSIQVSGIYSARTCQVTLVQGRKTGKGTLRVSNYSAKGKVLVPRSFAGQTVARVACGKDGTATSAPFVVVGPNEPTSATCEVLEKGFSQTRDNTAYLGLTVRNSAPTLSAESVEIAVTYRDSGGGVLKTDTIYLYDGIPAATTVVLSESTDVGMPAASVTLQSRCTTATTAVDPVLPSSARFVSSSYSMDVRGEVLNSLSRTISDLSSVHYLVRNASGAIIGGDSAFLDSFVTPGGTGTWDDYVWSDLPYSVSDGIEATVFVDYES